MPGPGHPGTRASHIPERAPPSPYLAKNRDLGGLLGFCAPSLVMDGVPSFENSWICHWLRKTHNYRHKYNGYCYWSKRRQIKTATSLVKMATNIGQSVDKYWPKRRQILALYVWQGNGQNNDKPKRQHKEIIIVYNVRIQK